MEWEMAKEVGYKPITNLWTNFTLAEAFGEEAIKSTAEYSFNKYKDNILYLTELIMVLNHKCWYWNDNSKPELTRLYINLYYQYDDKAINYIEKNMPKDSMKYYFNVLD